jgi:hypothetical protein
MEGREPAYDDGNGTHDRGWDVAPAGTGAGESETPINTRACRALFSCAAWIGAAHLERDHSGAVIIVISFAMDYGHITAGGIPRQLNWWVFATGGMCVVSYVGAVRGRARPHRAARNCLHVESR